MVPELGTPAKMDLFPLQAARSRSKPRPLCHCESLRRCAADVRKKMARITHFAVTHVGYMTYGHFCHTSQNLFS